MKRPVLAALAVIALASGLSACETATPYQQLNPNAAYEGGYRDIKLDATHWRVTFAGNSMTSRETVERYLLYRAAELTTTQGFDWFQETDQRTDKKSDVFVDPFYSRWNYGYAWQPSWRFRRAGRGGFSGGWSTWGPGWNNDPWGPTFVTEYNRYDVSADLMMGRGPKPPQALDAREVMANLGPTIVRPKT
jgi:hypothetical protein